MSKMTRAIRLSMPHPLADLKLLADSVFAATTPASAQSMQLNFAVLNGDLFRLECDYDPSEPWPVDFVALELSAWRATLAFQRLETTMLSVWSCFVRCIETAAPPDFGIVAQSQLVTDVAAHG